MSKQHRNRSCIVNCWLPAYRFCQEPVIPKMASGLPCLYLIVSRERGVVTSRVHARAKNQHGGTRLGIILTQLQRRRHRALCLLRVARQSSCLSFQKAPRPITRIPAPMSTGPAYRSLLPGRQKMALIMKINALLTSKPTTV